jgi:hypothetical protein
MQEVTQDEIDLASESSIHSHVLQQKQKKIVFD